MITTSSPSRFAYAIRSSLWVSSQRRLSYRCSAGCARRISFSRRISGRSGPFSVRRFTSYFSEFEVLLAPLTDRYVLQCLVAGVDPVARRQRRRQHEPRLEGRAAALLQVLVQDVRRVRPHVRPVVRRPRPHLLDELDQLRLRVLPREVRIGLREADLRERRHRRRARERLGEEDRLRVPAAHLCDQPLPERHRLRVRVVDAEGEDPAGAPAEHDVEQRLPELLALLGVPVDVVDVLVALGRVLRVLDRAVGAAVEPRRVLFSQGWSGSTGSRSRARSRAPPPRRPRPSRRSLRRSRDRDGARRGRRRRAPIAHGLPGSPFFARSALLRPLRKVSPIGCTGGR